MLPMGTIVAACMLVGLLIAARLPILEKLPGWLNAVMGWLVLGAGLWNVLWYAPRHLTEFWGFSALISGLLMIITAGFILCPDKLPGWLRRLRPIVLVMLCGYFLLYAVTIARL